MLGSLWVLFSYTPTLSWPSSPSPSSFSEQGEEWHPLIESARTLLSLFSLQKHAHVTLTFFIFFTVLAEYDVQTRSRIWCTIVYGPTAFIFPPPEPCWRLTGAQTTLCCSCLENTKTEGAASCGLVADLSPPGYNLHYEKKMEIGEVRLASNLWALSRVPAITTSDMLHCCVAFGEDSHATCSWVIEPTYRTTKPHQIMREHSNQSYRTSNPLLGLWNGKWKNKWCYFSCVITFPFLNKIKVNCAPTQKVWKTFADEFFMHIDNLIQTSTSLLTFYDSSCALRIITISSLALWREPPLLPDQVVKGCCCQMN